MSLFARCTFLALTCACSAVLAQDTKVRLHGEVFDSKTKQPLAARVYIQSEKGDWYFPKSASPEGTAVEYKRQAGKASVEQHVTLSAHPFIVDVPPGKYTITVERGKEYLPLTKEVTIVDQPVKVSLPLVRWITMVDRGWYSGDVHAHRPLADMPNLVLAEDLNVGMPLSHWVTASDTGPAQGNRVKEPAPKPEWITVDKTHGIYPLNTEYEIFTVGGKSHTLGAVLICGQKTVLDQGVPPVRRIAEMAHADGAFLDLEKHSWAWSPMIVPLMKVDLFELANNHCWRTEFAFASWTVDAAAKSMNLEMTEQGFTEWGWIDFGFKSYYAYLNCGFRMMPSAGTGAGVHPVPLGFGRVYVHVDGEFTFEKWKQALLAGRSFVTTGPLMDLRYNGKDTAETFRFDTAPATVRVTGPIYHLAANKNSKVEVLVNGDVVRMIDGRADADEGMPQEIESSAIDESITMNQSGWVAVRIIERTPPGGVRFAHSAPVFVEIANKPQVPNKAEVEHFVDRIERELARHKGVLSPDAIDEYREALMVYRDLLSRSK